MLQQFDDWVGVELSGGRYAVSAKLGEGGMGFVYLAHDRNLDTEVVIKVPRRSMLDNAEFAQRFAREIRSLVRLSHPHIVKVIDVGLDGDLPFAVMEYLGGGSLEERRPTTADGSLLRLKVDDTLLWLPDIASSLDFIHDQGYIHRDIKPANILFDVHGNVFLSDFGVAKVVADAAKTTRDRTLTETGMVLGTPEYMAPELIMGEPYDARVDQYALAVMIHELLSDTTPFHGATPAAVMVQQTTRQPPALHTIDPSISVELSEVILKALNKTPEHRYGTCGDFVRAIVHAGQDAKMSAAAATTVGPPALPKTRSGREEDIDPAGTGEARNEKDAAQVRGTETVRQVPHESNEHEGLNSGAASESLLARHGAELASAISQRIGATNIKTVTLLVGLALVLSTLGVSWLAAIVAVSLAAPLVLTNPPSVLTWKLPAVAGVALFLGKWLLPGMSTGVRLSNFGYHLTTQLIQIGMLLTAAISLCFAARAAQLPRNKWKQVSLIAASCLLLAGASCIVLIKPAFWQFIALPYLAQGLVLISVGLTVGLVRGRPQATLWKFRFVTVLAAGSSISMAVAAFIAKEYFENTVGVSIVTQLVAGACLITSLPLAVLIAGHIPMASEQVNIDGRDLCLLILAPILALVIGLFPADGETWRIPAVVTRSLVGGALLVGVAWLSAKLFERKPQEPKWKVLAGLWAGAFVISQLVGLWSKSLNSMNYLDSYRDTPTESTPSEDPRYYYEQYRSRLEQPS